MYAFSIILWELIHWKQAYKNINSDEIRDSIRRGERLSFDKNISMEILALVEICWDQIPKARPSCADIIKAINIMTLAKPDNELIALGLPVRPLYTNDSKQSALEMPGN